MGGGNFWSDVVLFHRFGAYVGGAGGREGGIPSLYFYVVAIGERRPYDTSLHEVGRNHGWVELIGGWTGGLLRPLSRNRRCLVWCFVA